MAWTQHKSPTNYRDMFSKCWISFNFIWLFIRLLCEKQCNSHSFLSQTCTTDKSPGSTAKIKMHCFCLWMWIFILNLNNIFFFIHNLNAGRHIPYFNMFVRSDVTTYWLPACRSKHALISSAIPNMFSFIVDEDPFDKCDTVLSPRPCRLPLILLLCLYTSSRHQSWCDISAFSLYYHNRCSVEVPIRKGTLLYELLSMKQLNNINITRSHVLLYRIYTAVTT